MHDYEIVEFEEKYAKELAEMWNRSSENWGGYDHRVTAEDIINEHKNNGHINDFLAVKKDNNRVVGYCSFSEYREEKDTLYIPLLNVEPDYQGKKIGKRLVLKAVERTIEYGYPRLDLHTWAGNTKAVPLYKKCGFFWEKREDSTHLMNFIPAVLQSEALKEYFTELDWYEDNKRDLSIKPDGSPADDYCQFEYKWENDGKYLCVGIESRARGINFIDNNDYKIELLLEDSEPVFGREYKVKYKIVNKQDNPLVFEIMGRNDKNIEFNINKKFKVETEKVIESSFFVNQIAEKINEHKTHPAVRADVRVNGKKIKLASGLKVRFPLNINLNVPHTLKDKGIRSEFYLDLKNGFDHEVEFSFSLPDSNDIIILKKDFNIKLKAKESHSLKVPYFLLSNCYYGPCLTVTVNCEQGENYNYSYRTGAVFKGRKEQYGGETEKGWVLYNGKHGLRLEKENNWVYMLNKYDEAVKTGLFNPQLGLPFSDEFSRIEPEKVEYYSEGELYCLRAIYVSEKMPDIHLIRIIKLSPEGLAEHYYQIFNLGQEESQEQIYLKQRFQHIMVNSYLPYNNKIIEIDGWDSYVLDYWNADSIDENWLYSLGEESSRGIIWPSDYQLNFNGWHIASVINLGKIPPGGCKETSSFYLSCNSFEDWKEIRKFALRKSKLDKKQVINKLPLNINNGNPFVNESLLIDIRENRNSELKGNISLSSSSESLIDNEFELSGGDHWQREINISSDNFNPVEMSFDFKFPARSWQERKIVLPYGEEKITKRVEKKYDYKVYSVSNGIFTIKNAPEFSHALYSLEDDEGEWFDSSFPEPGPKAWWNPWAGGIVHRPENLRKASLLEEKSCTEFVDIKDNFNNNWKGLKVSTELKENDSYQGLTLNHFYLLLPGLGVLSTFLQIEQNTGRYFNQEKFITESFFSPGDKLSEGWLRLRNDFGRWVKYRAGKINYRLKTSVPPFIEGSKRKNKLLLYSTDHDSKYYCHANLEIMQGNVDYKVSLESGEKLFTPPLFYIRTSKFINPEFLKDLKQITFN
ncbi:MAG: GNAT family N-acetyltransferase [bacterium]